MSDYLELLPAVDIAGGHAVQLVQGVAGSEKRFGDPVEAALNWQRRGAEWIHLVDLDAAFGRGHNRDLLARIVGTLDIAVEMSGGIRDDESLAAAMSTGCRRVNIGTAALEQPAWCAAAIATYGDRVAVGLDVRGRTLAARGWTEEGGDLYDVLGRLDAEGCARYVVTDVNKDGMLQGPNLDLLRSVCQATDRPVVASGGITELSDLSALTELVPLGVEGAIVGTALYEGRFTPRGRPGADPWARRMSLAVRVIPCLDVDGGRVVKGINFQHLRDAGDPVELAKVYDAEGADELTFLDISASHEGRATTMDIVSRTAEQVFIPLTVGGGVGSVEDVDRLLRAGADKVAVNTAAIRRPALVAEIADRFGNQVLVLSVDARRAADTDSGFEVTTHGGRRSAGLDAVEVGPRGRRAGGRGDPAQRDGRRRHPGRLRPRPDRRGPPGGVDPGDRLRGRRAGGPLRARGRGRCGRGAGRHRLPLRHPAGGRGEVLAGRRGAAGPLASGAGPSPRTCAGRPRATAGRSRSRRRGKTPTPMLADTLVACSSTVSGTASARRQLDRDVPRRVRSRGRVEPGDRHQELVAAQPGQQVASPDRRAEPARRPPAAAGRPRRARARR